MGTGKGGHGKQAGRKKQKGRLEDAKKPVRNYERRRQIEKVKGVRGQERRGLWARRPQTVSLEGRLEKVRGVQCGRGKQTRWGVCVCVWVCVCVGGVFVCVFVCVCVDLMDEASPV
jgi:hypothetical protein